MYTHKLTRREAGRVARALARGYYLRGRSVRPDETAYRRACHAADLPAVIVRSGRPNRVFFRLPKTMALPLPGVAALAELLRGIAFRVRAKSSRPWTAGRQQGGCDVLRNDVPLAVNSIVDLIAEFVEPYRQK